MFHSPEWLLFLNHKNQIDIGWRNYKPTWNNRRKIKEYSDFSDLKWETERKKKISFHLMLMERRCREGLSHCISLPVQMHTQLYSQHQQGWTDLSLIPSGMLQVLTTVFRLQLLKTPLQQFLELTSTSLKYTAVHFSWQSTQNAAQVLPILSKHNWILGLQAALRPGLKVNCSICI